MLESSSLPENPGAGDPENAGSGHRWPRKETMALLEIRSSLDAKFRDSSAKAPLWEEVSRKMGEFGFSRSAKKCKEKFENIYKYHKRTRDGRSAKSNGKAYRFFDQLEALDHQHHLLGGSETGHLGNVIFDAVPCSIHKPFADLVEGASNLSTSSTSSSSGGESELQSNGKKEKKRKKKKRKLAEFFERLMKEVVERQENLQRTFVEALEKCERDRVTREEAWKALEAERVKRETESLARERSIAAQKDAAVLAFLKKLAKNRSIPDLFPDFPGKEPENLAENTFLVDQEKRENEGFSGMGSIPNTLMPDQQGNEESPPEKTFLAGQEKYESRGFLRAGSSSSLSRWPKEEVDALIRLRTELDARYQENAPKGPLWEEISADMEKLRYKRSAKRCKEKWENINKYFKRVKEGNKRRYIHSRTCPYFDQLNALYSKKAKTGESSAEDSGCDLRPEELLMHMMGVQQGEGEGEEVDRQVNEDGSLEIENQPIEAPQNDTTGGSDQRVSDIDPSMDIMG